MTYLRTTETPRQKGLSLIELMIALALGMIIVIAVTNVYLSNRATFRSQEALSQIQQNARLAFELLTNDIREAGGNPCGVPSTQVVNVINSASTYWWANWAGGIIQGFNDDMNTAPITIGTGATGRVTGTDAIIIRGTGPVINGQDLTIINHDAAAETFTVSAAPTGVTAGDALIACDPKQATIFQVSSKNDGTKAILHDSGSTVVSPGNSTTKLGAPTCPSPPCDYTFEKTGAGALSRLHSVLWYIGNNDHGGSSLFRVETAYTTTPAKSVKNDIQEIADGVTDLQLEYLGRNGTALDSAFVAATNGTDWSLTVAVRITLTIQSTNKAGTDQKSLERKFVHVVSLRNREIVQ